MDRKIYGDSIEAGDFMIYACAVLPHGASDWMPTIEYFDLALQSHCDEPYQRGGCSDEFNALSEANDMLKYSWLLHPVYFDEYYHATD